MSRHYVCATCLGKGYQLWVDAEDGYQEKDPCGSCVGQGYPPCIELPDSLVVPPNPRAEGKEKK